MNHSLKGVLDGLVKKDTGLYDAMNKGFRMATGEIIGIINSDDLIAETTAIEKNCKVFLKLIALLMLFMRIYIMLLKSDTSKIVRYWKSGKQRPFAKKMASCSSYFLCQKVVYEKVDCLI